MSANDRQVGGTHYQKSVQHWDFAAANDMDYFQGAITKYVTRWKNKGGIEDLKKAQHYLEKYIEVEEAKAGDRLAATLGDAVSVKEVTPSTRSASAEPVKAT